MTAPTINGQMICASNCAYAIDASGVLPLDGTDRYYAGAGFVRPPTTFLGGKEDINACLVGTIPDGVVVAFRGTLPPDHVSLPILLDWINDINATPVEADGFPGRVHEGFLGSLDSLWIALVPEIKAQLAQAGAAAKLFVTGHSKGGAVAPLAGWRLQNAEGIAARVVTFAGARCGTEAFAAAYNAVIEHDRYEYADDIVPHLPPSDDLIERFETPIFHLNPFKDLDTYDYEPAGKLLYIQRDGTITEEFDGLDNQRLRDLAHAVIHGQFQQIGDDHRVACGWGYMSAVCPTGVCE